MSIAVGKKVPAFSLPATSDKQLALKDFKGKKLVLYFYPKDSTPGCTTEGNDFKELYPQFLKENCDILGISRDTIKRHENFKAKQEFPFELLSDEEEVLCGIFDVIKLKKLYGKEYLGIDRSTFIIDETGKLAKEWRKVKVTGHAAEVLEAVKSL
ncbi:MAG: peroxiredoxin [Gammaproteobacteria bacterium]|jgi:peroxiredoxin Q/BCP|nr:peroxiredoxin [Gammaproteobacteria bacterium]MBQ0773589.1 peroxiredoxin [Gammaproteobacteria bacterium]|tara:strand:- start:138878 stop:139342 length:465 start_codon:yes stop_codon:yes gene_type:complete